MLPWGMLEESIISSKIKSWGAWVAQSVERPTLAQVVISQSLSSSPALGSVRTAQSLEPALGSVSPSLSLALPSFYSVSVSLSQINKNIFKKLKKTVEKVLWNFL